MFGISWSELLVVLAVAVVVIGPKDLPRVLYAAGKFLRKVKAFTVDIQLSLERIMQDEELDDITRTANRAGGDNLEFHAEQQKAIEERRLRRLAEEGAKDGEDKPA